MQYSHLDEATEAQYSRALGSFRSFNAAELEQAVLSAILRNADALNALGGTSSRIPVQTAQDAVF